MADRDRVAPCRTCGKKRGPVAYKKLDGGKDRVKITWTAIDEDVKK
jgi:hypothetical protein